MTLFELNKPKHIEKEYLESMKDGLIDRIINGKIKGKSRVLLSDSMKSILIPNYNGGQPDYSRVETLLIGEPSRLFQLNNQIKGEINLVKDRPSDCDLEVIFDYDGIFNSTSKSKAYNLSLKIGANTCCYCNRQYTFTVVTNGNNNSNDRITRPAFDHWFPKSKFPLLSISLYNLIPSCTICNSSAKGSQNVDLENFIHPYDTTHSKPKIEFMAVPSTEDGKRWTIKIDRKQGSREDNTIKLFCLDKIYKMHDLLELKDIMDFKENYSEEYLKELMDLLKNKSINPSLTTKDVYRMLFGVEYDDDKNLDRPFGKMKNDILKNILSIK